MEIQSPNPLPLQPCRHSDAPEKTEYCASWGCSCAGGRKPYPYQQEKDQSQVFWRRDMKGMYIAHSVGILKDFKILKSISLTNRIDEISPNNFLLQFAIVLPSRTISNHTRPPKSWQNGVRHCHCLRPQCGMGSRWVIVHVERWQ